MFNFNCGGCREHRCNCNQWSNCEQFRPCHEQRSCGCNSWFNCNQCDHNCHQTPCNRPCKNNDWDNKCKPCKRCEQRFMSELNGFEQGNFERDFDERFISNNFGLSNFNRGGCSHVRPIFFDNNSGSFGNGCEVSIINPTFTPEV